MIPQTPDIIKELHKITQSKTTLIKWDNQNGEWTNWQYQKLQIQGSQQSRITTMTYNVLLDELDMFKKRLHKQNILHSQQRYQYILQKVGQLSPDVIGFNEVTQNFYDKLKHQEWARKQYWISNYKAHQGSSNVILTRIQPIFVDRIYVEKLQRPIQAVFIPFKTEKTTKIVCFSSVHLTAFVSNASKREVEFNLLIEYLKRYQPYVDSFVLQGDMNFHSQNQNYIYKSYGMTDGWLEKYELADNPGYTFDSHINKFINQLYWGFQRRRMRLDRILYSGNCISVNNIAIAFNKGIEQSEQMQNRGYHGYIKGGLLFINDLLGWRMGREPKQNYLFASDHFGLTAELQLKESI